MGDETEIAPPLVSPDGRFYWDGTQWVPFQMAPTAQVNSGPSAPMPSPATQQGWRPPVRQTDSSLPPAINYRPSPQAAEELWRISWLWPNGISRRRRNAALWAGAALLALIGIVAYVSSLAPSSGNTVNNTVGGVAGGGTLPTPIFTPAPPACTGSAPPDLKGEQESNSPVFHLCAGTYSDYVWYGDGSGYGCYFGAHLQSQDGQTYIDLADQFVGTGHVYSGTFHHQLPTGDYQVIVNSSCTPFPGIDHAWEIRFTAG